MTIKEVKRILGISNKDIAEMFGYANRNSYQAASRKKHIENGIVEIFKKTEQLSKNNCTLNRQTCGNGSGCKYPHCHI